MHKLEVPVLMIGLIGMVKRGNEADCRSGRHCCRWNPVMAQGMP